MRSIKVHTLTAGQTDMKAITVKDVIDISIVNGAIEFRGNVKDDKGYASQKIIAAFAKDSWKYFEEA
jgi:hypothetical protein